MADVNPHLDTIAPWISAGIRRTVATAELATVFPDTYQQVAAAAGRAGAQLVGPAYGCYFGMPSDVVDVEIGFGIDSEADIPDLIVTAHPAQRAVVATHTGPYDKLHETYDALMPWLAEQDLDLSDAMWELYESPPETDPAETVTRIVFPLRAAL